MFSITFVFAEKQIILAGKCVLCNPVLFYDSEMYYFEHFYAGLTEVEVTIAKNLYRNRLFHLFSRTQNWFCTINSNSIIHLTDSE